MQHEERALAFACGGEWLYGVASVPQRPFRCGVLVVVGGPQYRAGSHRQFTLLARALAAQGIAAMRFDYRGMGDSGGQARAFDAIAPDLRAAVGQFMAAVPALERVVLWGLCDGASAAALYAPSDRRVAALVMLNPWVRSPASMARTTLKHYYRGRLLDPELWNKIRHGRFEAGAALRSLFKLVAGASGLGPAAAAEALPLSQRIHAALVRFPGPVLLVVSGADLTAREFTDLAGGAPEWRRLLAAPRIARRDLPGADHTFSRRAWRDQVAAWTADWVRTL